MIESLPFNKHKSTPRHLAEKRLNLYRFFLRNEEQFVKTKKKGVVGSNNKADPPFLNTILDSTTVFIIIMHQKLVCFS